MRISQVLLAVFALLWANGITVSNLVVNQAAGTVTFDISWQNSWRDAENWDAAWVFVKFRDCSVPKTVPFTHGLVSTTLTDHTFPTTLEPTCANGNAACIDPSPDNTGVMLRRTSNGFGTISGTVTLRVTNLPATGTYDVRVIAIEMVFIPEGAFYAGDATSPFSLRTSSSDNSPKYITSEASTTISHIQTGVGNYTLTANFRKGYAAFYIMKYEISQGQYTDFLNTIGQLQAPNRFPNQNGFGRHTISYDGMTVTYNTTRPDRAMNYMYWQDFIAYLDWAALRPLTELEYEKACRGPLAPVPNEFAWGTINYTAGTTLSGAENGTETFTNPNANMRRISELLTGGDGGFGGPVRVGIFATASTTTREASGASYYGVFNMSDNVGEYYYRYTAGQAPNLPSNGIPWGDGNLDASGSANTTNWVLTCNTTDVTIRGTTNSSASQPYATISGRQGVPSLVWGGSAGTINDCNIAPHPYLGGRGGR